ncbi:SIS domain-containing protein [Chelatococcus sp. SYSU_G07232]|uniref:SIS domain-containing protein n=1 Tax=Chelatococcus albus TaxID=3047466 RepID=A0ABT7AFM2_9HYPH|nr:SIS domain-containing protein [Chelatococcus sp. SYSU_G07232]MDJ1158174.1 SIS domain-containing protein [Chelatococcus sp. SYSU_G07232]
MTHAPAGETLMLREAREAPVVVARLIDDNTALCRELGARLRAAPPPFAVTCARGSSDNAATYVKYLLETRLGLVTASVGPSVSSVYAGRPRVHGALFLAVSQSGRSPDILHLSEAARAEGAVTVALVNDAASPLADICETVMPLRAGPERSVAATKSFIAALAAELQLYAHWQGDADLLRTVERLPEDLETALARDWSAALPVLAQAKNLFVVGRGVGFAAAQEAALKLKETCGLHAEALSAAELLHGPMTLAGPDFPVLVLSQDDPSREGLAALTARLVDRGVPVIVAGPAAGRGVIALDAVAAADPVAAPIALIQSFYPLVDAVARARGRDPDNPPHLRKVTETV